MSIWYALQVYGGNEKKCIEKTRLKYPQYRYFLPMRELEIRRRGKTNRIMKPFYSGYFFLNSDTHLDFIQAREIVANARTLGLQPGIIRMVGAYFDKKSIGSDHVEPVNENEIQFVRHLTNEKDVIPFSKYIRVDDHIKVVSGPMKGLEGLILRVNHRKKRITIKTTFLGQTRKIDVGAEEIEKTDSENNTVQQEQEDSLEATDIAAQEKRPVSAADSWLKNYD